MVNASDRRFGLAASLEPAKPETDSDRVALFLPTLVGGGAERAFVNLAWGMSEMVEHVDLVVGNANGVYRAEVPASVRLVDLSARRLAFSLPGLVRYMRASRPRCVYSALEEANILNIIAKYIARIPIKIFPSLRNNISEEYDTNRSFKLLLMNRMSRYLYKYADRVIAVSEGVATDASAYLRIPRERIVVISNPTITPDLAELSQAPLEHPWFAPGSPPVVLGCGRLTAQKDFGTLLEAFALLRQKMPARLVILGEGLQRSPLLAQADRLGISADVSLAGFDPNPFRYMARSAVFVLSSVHEGSPNVLVQALACGCPVVATDCPSGPREILQGVAQGQLVPVSDPAAMAAAIAEFLQPGMTRPAPLVLRGFDYLSAATAYLSLLHP